jgi:hypothetical protein
MIDATNKVALLRFIREQVKAGKPEEFSLPESSSERVAPPLLEVAQAGQPSASQKEKACVSLLNEARRAIDSILEPFSGMTADEIANLLKSPNSRKLLHDNLDVAAAKLAVVRDQCGDVLPAGAMEEIEELEKKLNRVRDMLGDEGRTGPDLLAIAGQVLDAVGNGLSTVAGIVTIMLRMFFGPGMQRTEGSSNLLVAQGKAHDDTLPSSMQRN